MGACLRLPAEVLQHVLQGRVYGLRIVVAALCALLADEIGRLAEVGGEGRVARQVFVALVAIEQGCRTHADDRSDGLCLVDDVHEVALQEVNLVAHRARRIDDEGDVGLWCWGGCGCVQDEVVRSDFLSDDVPVCYGGHSVHQLSVDAEAQALVVGVALLLEQSHPAVGLSVVVGLRLPDGGATAQQLHGNGSHRLAAAVHHLYRHAVVGVEIPVFALVGKGRVEHQLRPERPVLQVAPLAGGDDAGMAVAIIVGSWFAATDVRSESRVGFWPVVRTGEVVAVFTYTTRQDEGAGQHHDDAGQPREMFLCVHSFHCLVRFLVHIAVIITAR